MVQSSFVRNIAYFDKKKQIIQLAYCDAITINSVKVMQYQKVLLNIQPGAFQAQ